MIKISREVEVTLLAEVLVAFLVVPLLLLSRKVCSSMTKPMDLRRR